MGSKLRAVTLASNTAGTLALISSGTLTLAGGANITLSQAGGNGITIIGGAGGGNFSGGVSTGGNTVGTTGLVGSQIVFAGGANITLSQSTVAGGSATITISGGAGGAAGSNTLGMSNLGNTSGTTGVVSGSAIRFVFAGGNNITLSQSLDAGNVSGTITISAANETQTVPPIGTAVKVIQSSGSTGTITRFAPEDHAHQGVGGWDVNAIASTFFGTMQLSAGAMISIATGGNTSRGSAQIIDLWSSATTASQVTTANVVGANASRLALEGHQHAGIHGLVLSGTASTFLGDFTFNSGNMISFATAGNSTAGSMSIIDLWSSATTASQITTANVVGANASRVALEGHQHQGVHGLIVSGTASTFVGDFTFNSGAMISFATAGNSTSGSLSIINLWSSATTASRVESANVVGANASRIALEGHQHAGLWAIDVAGNTSGGNTSSGAGSLRLAGGPNITLSGSTVAGGMTLSISAAAAGGALTLDYFYNLSPDAKDTQYHITSVGTADQTVFVVPLAWNAPGMIFPGVLTCNTFLAWVSGNHTNATASTAAKTYSAYFGIYTEANSTSLALLNSVSVSAGTGGAASNQTASWHGPRWITIHSSQWSVQPTFSQTRYYLGYMMKSAGQSFALSWVGQGLGEAQDGMNGTWGVSSATNTSQGQILGPLVGRYATASAVLPVNIGASDLQKIAASFGAAPGIILNNRFAGTW